MLIYTLQHGEEFRRTLTSHLKYWADTWDVDTLPMLNEIISEIGMQDSQYQRQLGECQHVRTVTDPLKLCQVSQCRIASPF